VASYLTPEQQKVYRLIYGRFLATQMASAVYRQRSVAVEAGAYALEASGSELSFDGFLRALPERREKEATFPPKLTVGQPLALTEIGKLQFTEPPRRFSEAGLVNCSRRRASAGRYVRADQSVIQNGYAVKDGASVRPTLGTWWLTSSPSISPRPWSRSSPLISKKTSTGSRRAR
jgi:DNA topoisomerase-1